MSKTSLNGILMRFSGVLMSEIPLPGWCQNYYFLFSKLETGLPSETEESSPVGVKF